MHVLITGANRGIGLEFCRQYAANGDRVTALCRSASPELKDLGVTIIDDVDVCQVSSLKRAAEEVEGEVEVLINNAGILNNDSFGALTAEELLRHFEVNTVGPLLVSQHFRDHLKAGSKIAMITSRVGSIADNSSGGIYGYRMSKAALNMGAYNLSLELKEHRIPVGIFHPGMVQTDMTGGRGITPKESVTGLRERISELDMDKSGEFRHTNGEALPW